MCSLDESTPKFRFLIPGQPPTVNHMYTLARGSRRMVKNSDVAAYQTMVTLIVRTASKPKGFPGSGQIRVTYWLSLGRDIDCDNALKALNDAIAVGLEINDRRFVPCVAEKRIGVTSPSVRVEMAAIDSPS